MNFAEERMTKWFAKACDPVAGLVVQDALASRLASRHWQLKST